MNSPEPRFPLLAPYAEEIGKCVRCGTCTSVCPVYRETVRESHSARGKMSLLEALLEGRLAPSRELRDRAWKCLQCLRCVENCPQGIPVSDILLAAWTELERAIPGSPVERFFFERIFASPMLMEILSSLSLPLQGLVFARLKGVPAGTSRIPLPGFPGAAFPLPQRGRRMTGVHKADSPKGKVLLYPGCMATIFFPSVVEKSVRVLNHCGFTVEVPRGAHCCGTPLASLGYRDKAAQLARENLALFEKGAFDAVVTPCPTCAFTIRHKYALLLGSAVPAAQKVVELASFLGERGLFDKFKSLEGGAVTYHDSCHLRRGLGGAAPPREALERIYGEAFTEAPWAGQCCGFGGVFSFHEPALSQGVRGALLASIGEAAIPEIVTSCPACVFQIGSGLAIAGVPSRVRHLADVLDEAR